MISPPNDRWVRQIANLVGTLGKIDLGGSFICTSYDSFRSYGTKQNFYLLLYCVSLFDENERGVPKTAVEFR